MTGDACAVRRRRRRPQRRPAAGRQWAPDARDMTPRPVRAPALDVDLPAGDDEPPGPPARHVHVVKPLRRAEPPPPPEPRFSRALEARLRRLRSEEPPADGDKPRFVTTVKCGQFLPPPPELARSLGLDALYPARERDRLVYSYASKPAAVAPRPRRAVAPGEPPPKRAAVAALLGGVRALAAGVAGVHRVRRVDPGNPPHVALDASGSVAPPYANVMHDKRVVRGSTTATHPMAAGDGESAASRAARSRRRALARRAAAARLRPGTPPPAPGRRHHPIQTEYYLEELFDKGAELEVGVQTDLFADRPATPVYVPAKTGADAFTQIYPGDLFDFELEVAPLLEVLVGKSAEQALAEVAQEEELAALREQQRRFAELRDAELAERQRLAAQQLRLQQEKERRVAQARGAQRAAADARERCAAAALVQGYVAELLPAALAGLRDQGYLVERVQRGVDEEFMPWLVQQVSREVEAIITSRDVIIEIVRDVVEARAELFRETVRGQAQAQATASPPDSDTPPSLPATEHEPAESLEE